MVHAKRFDALVVHGLWQFHAAAARRSARASGLPYVVFPHGMLDPWFNRASRVKHAKKLVYWAAIERAVLRDAAAVLYTCAKERSLARGAFPLYRATDEVVGLGVSIPTQHGADSQISSLVNRFPVLAGKRIALFLGRIHPKKGCDVLLQAFTRTLARSPDWQLVMAGPDQIGWGRKLQAQAADLGVDDRVTWTGMLEGDLKWGALRSAEIFVLPSHQENFGVSVAEALGCGTPVLISSEVNISSEIEADGAGLVAPDTLDGAIALLTRWSELTPDARAALRNRAQRCFRMRFEIGASARRLISVLERVTSEHVGRELARARP